MRQLIPNAYPTSFLVDFEMSAINANQMVFDYDDLTVSGCFFHLNENVRKHMQQIGLQRRYQNDPEFALLPRYAKLTKMGATTKKTMMMRPNLCLKLAIMKSTTALQCPKNILVNKKLSKTSASI